MNNKQLDSFMILATIIAFMLSGFAIGESMQTNDYLRAILGISFAIVLLILMRLFVTYLIQKRLYLK